MRSEMVKVRHQENPNDMAYLKHSWNCKDFHHVSPSLISYARTSDLRVGGSNPSGRAKKPNNISMLCEQT